MTFRQRFWQAATTVVCLIGGWTLLTLLSPLLWLPLCIVAPRLLSDIICMIVDALYRMTAIVGLCAMAATLLFRAAIGDNPEDER